MPVPFLDVRVQDDAARREIISTVTSLIERAVFIGGPEVESFSKEFGAYCAGTCVTLANGTDALIVALRALGVGPGDEVITVPFTFIATAEAIGAIGAKVRFVDVDPKTYTMDVKQLAKAVGPKTKTILPVHLFGQPADMDPIIEIAARYKLKIVEDACQAHGAEYKGVPVGAIGDIGCFSFYPTKNLGGMGDGGAVVSRDTALLARVAQIADHGRIDRYRHAVEGLNSRLDSFQAAGLRVKLRHLPAKNDRRRAIADQYGAGLKGLPHVSLPYIAPYAKSVFHLYSIESDRRDALMAHLQKLGIGCGVYYPIPLHLQPAYEHLGLKKGSFPVSERASERILALPMFPEMTDAQVAEVIAAVRSFA